MNHEPREFRGRLQVWCVVETTAGASDVRAVKNDEGAARIAARALQARLGEPWRVRVTGPHIVSSDYI